MYFGTEKAAMRAYAPEVINQNREFWVGNKNLRQKSESRMTKPKQYKSSLIQRQMPYLIKQKFVPLENAKVDLQRYEHEDEPDTGGYKGFKQSKDNYKA